MKQRKIQVSILAVILALFGIAFISEQQTAVTVKADGCQGLPKEVSQLMEEWEEAGVKTDCRVNQVLNWAATHAADKSNLGAIMTEGMQFMRALGYDIARGTPMISQDTMDAYRKREGGVPKAFAAWKGNNASVIYIPSQKQYITVQYQEIQNKATTAFNIKAEYDKESGFSDEDKAKIQESIGWWKDKLADKFEITIEFILDPSLNAGGTTLVGDVPRSCIDHEPRYAEIKLKEVNTSLVSHEIGHALGIGTAAVFKVPNVCSRLAEMSKDVQGIELNSAKIQDGKFWGNNSKGVSLFKDRDNSYSHVSSDVKDDDGNHSAVQPGLGGKPSIIDIRILEDLGYEYK